MTVLVHGAEPASLEEVRQSLLAAFDKAQEAVEQGSPIIFEVVAEDLLGHRGPERAAYVGALVGIARAMGFEGARQGWKANVVARPADQELTDQELEGACPVGASGQVIVLGTGLVGKVAP